MRDWGLAARGWAVHAFRVLLVLLALAALRRSDGTDSISLDPPPSDFVSQLFSADVVLSENPISGGLWPALDKSQDIVGYVARTRPAASKAIGYAGPTEAIVALTPGLKILKASLLWSADTAEHVEAVSKAEDFYSQFVGWDWNAPPDGSVVDGVSGATLTSMALAEGLLLRMGGATTSLVFSRPIDLIEVQQSFSQAVRLQTNGPDHVVTDSENSEVGRVFRSGPLSDEIIGYQGATELLVSLGDENRWSNITIRESFDNQPYVGYVEEDRWFWKDFKGKSDEELARLDIESMGVEGVSGATMTSLAVAETIVATAKGRVQERILAREREAAAQRSWFEVVRFAWTDWLTLLTIGSLFVVIYAGWFRNRRFRVAWLCCVLIGIGFVCGNLISMALFAGWASSGVAWQLAPSLATLFLLAVFAPPLSKQNAYCSHLCPHGAIQQLVRPGHKTNRKLRIGHRWQSVLKVIPVVMLILGYVCTVLSLNVSLSLWEPFHAYLFRVAGWWVTGFAIATVLFSAFVPMGYCRFGCPTGTLLDYLRRSARSHRIGFADGLAVSAVIFGWSYRWWLA